MKSLSDGNDSYCKACMTMDLGENKEYDGYF